MFQIQDCSRVGTPMFTCICNKKKFICLRLAAGFFLLNPAAANAEKSGFIAKFKEIAVYDSNPLIRNKNKASIIGSETTASVKYAKKAITHQFKAGVSFTRNQFNNSKFSFTDFYGFSGLNFEKNKWNFSIDGNALYDTTRSNELTTLGLDIESTRRYSYSLKPKISYKISPRNILNLSANLKERYYDDTSLTDYRTYFIKPAFAHKISPKQTVRFGWLFSRYQSLEGSARSLNTGGPSLNWAYIFRPYLSLKLSGNLLKTKYHGYSGITRQKDKYNPTYSAIIEYGDTNNDIEISVVKTRYPYPNGTESYITTYAVRDIYDVNKKLSFDIAANYQDARKPPFSTDSLDTAWNIMSGLSYKISKNLNMRASYEHCEERLKNDDGAAKRNIVKLGLSREFNGN